MMNRFFIFFLFLLTSNTSFALKQQHIESASNEEKIIRYPAFSTHYRGDLWQDPALRFFYLPYSMTEIKGTGDWLDKGKACIRQTGDNNRYIGVNVHSFVILSDESRVFGEASYRNEKQDNLSWNENLDWKLIAPYVTGDSIGGFMKSETYRLKGGYTYQFSKWTVGMEADYRAAHSYRDKDPRPQNTASDLKGTLGASLRINRYRLSLSGHLRWYQQHSDIAFLADKGSTSVYHASGLGTNYVRFGGTQTASKHKGVQWGIQLGLLPVAHGVSAMMAFSHLSMEKQLSKANNLPLQHLGTTEIKGNVTWMKELPSDTHWGTKIEASHQVRKGIEYIYGEAGGNEYGTLIGKRNGIEVNHSHCSFQGLWEQLPIGHRQWGGAVVTSLIYHRLQADLPSASRYVHSSAAQGLITARLYFRPGLLTLLAEWNGGYCGNITNRSSLGANQANLKEDASQTAMANIRYLTDNYSLNGVRLQGSYPITQQTYVSLSLQWQSRQYKACGNTQQASCSVGISF